jgi:hypothetical protein
MAFAVDGIRIRQCVAFIIEVSWYRVSRVHGRGRISEGMAALQTRPRLLTLAERTAAPGAPAALARPYWVR